MDIQKIKELNNKYLEETGDNVRGVGYTYKTVDNKITEEKSICFFVEKKLPIDQLRPEDVIPKQIEYLGETFSTDVVQITVKTTANNFCYDSHYTWWEDYPTTYVRPTNRDKKRPIKGGISLTNWTSSSNSVGTLGFLAKDEDDGSIVGVTNAHVIIPNPFLANERSSYYPDDILGDIATQPNEVWDGDYGTGCTIGAVKRYIPLRIPSTLNRVDAALITLDSSVVSNTESWKQEGLSITECMPFATTSEIDDIMNGVTDTLLYSAGRTTGPKGELETKLKIFGTASFTIGYETSEGTKFAKYEDIIMFFASPTTATTENMCYFPMNQGDSGSAVIADIGGVKKIIGLLFSGGFTTISNPFSPTPPTLTVSLYGFACRIDHIASELNISAWSGDTLLYSDRNNISGYTVSGKSSDPYIIVEGKKYWQAGIVVGTPGPVDQTVTPTITPTITPSITPNFSPEPTSSMTPTPTPTVSVGSTCLSCSPTGIFQYAHSSVVVDGVMFLGERRNADPYIIRFPNPNDLSTYQRIQVTGVGTVTGGLESVVYSSITDKIYFGSANSTNGNLVLVEIDPSDETLSYTKHEISTDASYFGMATDGNYIYGGTNNYFFKIQISDWSLTQESFGFDFALSHSAQVNSSRGQFYVTGQGSVNKLAIVDMNDLSSYTIVDVGLYATVLTDDMAYYDTGSSCKVYIGGESSGAVSVDITNGNALSSITINPSYGLFISGTTIYSASMNGAIQKFNVSNPSNITTYTLDDGFIPNEILFNGNRLFVTKWDNESGAKICEYFCQH